MTRAFGAFVGGRLGDGWQWMPWIHEADEVGDPLLLESPAAMGRFNLVAPEKVRNVASLARRWPGGRWRGEASIRRLQQLWPTLRLIHLPLHASWLNQIEIYFSIVQRKVLTPNDFANLELAQRRVLDSQDHFRRSPHHSSGSSRKPT